MPCHEDFTLLVVVVVSFAIGLVLSPGKVQGQDSRRPAKLTATVIRVNDVDAADAAYLIRDIYGASVKVEAVPEKWCISIRADAKTTQEVKQLIGRLEQAARKSGTGPITVIAGSAKIMAGQEEVRKLLEAIQSSQNVPSVRVRTR